ncbi:hypothetical protein V1224_05245 [Lachnospiraceae bacterium JLR.KK008]
MFDFAAIKATLLNTALNAGIFLVASVAIQGLAKVLDNYIHKVEKARERTTELFSEFKQRNDTLADHRKTVSELAGRYEELSKGVNLSDNENRSLSTEDYEEFLNINERLASSFPELAKGIDENGNSILALGTKGITAKEQLEDLLQTEEDLNNFRTAQGLEETFEGVYTYVEEANEATDKLNGSISDSSKAMDKLQDIAENGINLTGENNQLLFAGNTNNQAELDYWYSLTDSVNEFWQSLDGQRRVELSGLGIDNSTLFHFNTDDNTGAFEVYSQAYNLSPDERTALENIIQDNVGEVSSALLDSVSDQKQSLQEQIQKGENAWADFIPLLISSMKSKSTFQNLDPDLHDIAIQIVEGLDYSYASAMKAYDPDPYAYIRDKFIVPMGRLNDSDKRKLQSNFEALFLLDAGNLSQDNQTKIERFINTIAVLLKKDPFEIRVALGFDVEDSRDRYEKALNEAKRQLGGYGHDDRGFEVNNAVGYQLDDFWNEHVVTEDDWVLWQKVTEGITDYTEAVNAFTEAKKNAVTAGVNDNNLPLSVSSTISQLTTQLMPAFDALKSAYQSIFTEDGFTLENVDLSMLDSIKSSIDDLNSMEGVDISVDYASFENLARVLTDTASTEDDVHEAIDLFATDIVSSLNPALSQCSGEAYLMMQSLLESLGVMNSEQAMASALGYTYEEYAAAKKECADAGFDLANATEEQIADFIQEQGGAENCGAALATLQLKKLLVNSASISTLSDVNQILSLAKAAGISADSLVTLANAKAQFETAQAQYKKDGSRESQQAMALAARGMKEASGKVKEDILNYEPVEFAPKGNGTGSGGGASRSQKETAETFDWIAKAIEAIEDDLSRLDKAASSAYASAIEKNEALSESIGKINEEILLQQQAYKQYMAKAEAAGLSDEYKNLVQNGGVAIESITDADLKEAIKTYEQWYDKAEQAQHQIDELHEKAKDKHVAAYELEAGEIEKLRENQVITEREYLDAMQALYEKYYAGQTGFANQAKDARLKLLQEEKEFLETIADAAASLLDGQIKDTGEEKDRARKAYEDQIDAIEEIIDAREREKDAVQQKIDALKDEGDELDRQKTLLDAVKSRQEALFALERAKNQRSQMLYQDGQMVWTVDDASIREAGKSVEDAQAAVDKAERDIQIADLQAQIDLIQDGIDALEDQKAQIEALADESDAFFDKKIADIEAYQSRWNEAFDSRERSAAMENLKAMFGEDAPDQILAHSDALLSTLAQSCIDTQAAIDLVTAGAVGALTQQWGELAGVSVSMDNAMRLSGLSMDELTGKAGLLGLAIGQTADSSRQIGEALNAADTTAASEQFHTAGASAQEMQQQVEGVTQTLDTLTSDVQGLSIPAPDTRAFAAALSGEDGAGGILGQLHAFIERFRGICLEIPSIWNGMIQSISGQETASGQATGCDALFAPLLTAMDTAKTAIDTKLTEYAGAWTQFHTDLGAIIGISAGGGAGKEAAGKGKHGLSLPSGKAAASGDGKGSAPSEGGTIVGTITAGGQAATAALNESWIPGFEGFAASIDHICSCVCTMTADMANEVIDMVNAALKALKELQAKNTSAYKIDKVTSGYAAHPVSAANAYGTLSSPDGSGAIVRDQTSLVNELGSEMIARGGTLYEIPRGAQEVQLKKGDIVFNHRQTEELKRHHRVTSGGGRGKLIGAFASGTADASSVSVLEGSIRELWDSEQFQKLLDTITGLKTGQDTVIEQNDGLLRDRDGAVMLDKNGNPYPRGSFLGSDGHVYTPLPDDHPDILMGKRFDAYVQRMGGPEFLSVNAMARHEQQMESMLRQITNSTVVMNNNKPSITIGDIHVTCPGVTRQQVAEQLGYAIGDELNKQFNGLSLYAYQDSRISR